MGDDIDWEERIREFETNPAFTGTFEFDIKFDILGQRVLRRMRANYRVTPDWEYYDLKRSALHKGRGASSSIGFEILTVPSEDHFESEARDGDDVEGETDHGSPDEDSDWVPFEAFGGEGILPYEVWDAIDDGIEARCKAEDAERRRQAGLSAS
jgi:hypothetical protein